MRIPDRYGLVVDQVSHDVGHDAVSRPITAADYVSGPSRRHLHAMIRQFFHGKERSPIRRDN
jgi:hypothetical protein